MDRCLWLTFGAFDLVHSSHKWVPTMLLCGEHSTTVQAWIISRLWFCKRSRRLKINIRKSSVHFRESHAWATKLYAQETDFSFTQFHRSWNHFSRCRFTHGRYSRSHSLGFGEILHSIPNRTDGLKREPRGNPSAVAKPKHAQLHPNQAHQRHSN